MILAPMPESGRNASPQRVRLEAASPVTAVLLEPCVLGTPEARPLGIAGAAVAVSPVVLPVVPWTPRMMPLSATVWLARLMPSRICVTPSRASWYMPTPLVAVNRAETCATWPPATAREAAA